MIFYAKNALDRFNCQGRAIHPRCHLDSWITTHYSNIVHLYGPFDNLHLHSLLSNRNSLWAHIMPFLPCHRLIKVYILKAVSVNKKLYFFDKTHLLYSLFTRANMCKNFTRYSFLFME